MKMEILYADISEEKTYDLPACPSLGMCVVTGSVWGRATRQSKTLM